MTPYFDKNFQVGNVEEDKAFWGRSEEYDGDRSAFKVSKSKYFFGDDYLKKKACYFEHRKNTKRKYYVFLRNYTTYKLKTQLTDIQSQIQTNYESYGHFRPIAPNKKIKTHVVLNLILF